MSNTDLLILIPAIPAIPIVATVYLPWERWIPWGKLPKIALGPYILYLSFAAWHFNLGYWFPGLLVVAGTVVTILGVLEKFKAAETPAIHN